MTGVTETGTHRDVFDAVVLAGGRARRMGGADKPGARVGGRALIGWVAAAAGDARRLIVVGPPRADLPHAIVVREDPPGGGPVPALRAGLAEVTAPWAAVLAADLPFLRAGDLAALLAAARRAVRGDAPPRTGAVLLDQTGHPQWLCGVWPAEPLRRALAGYRGGSLRGLLEPLRPWPVTAAATERPAWFDCDTPEELDRARRLAT